MSEPASDRPTQHGFGRALVAVYAVFALAASARSIYQLLAKASEAPVAYTLSAVAGVVYVVATYALATDRRRLAGLTIGFELAGVLGVGLLTIVDPQLFPEATVWSDFGVGYGFVPLVLPVVGLWWLHRTRPASTP
ncbi:membrane protein [Aeromicrobium halocynthiae]|uniref:Membrane protein n=1 Tax=Aeromicrobium halocynthiae TaxID=560557 RepID=A0ABN2VR16_9ACTN